MPRYKTLRLREEDYKKLREVQRLLRAKGTDSIDWGLLRKQKVVDLPPEAYEDDEDDEGEDEEEESDFTWGFVAGLGAAALAYLILKSQNNQGGNR